MQERMLEALDQLRARVVEGAPPAELVSLAADLLVAVTVRDPERRYLDVVVPMEVVAERGAGKLVDVILRDLGTSGLAPEPVRLVGTILLHDSEVVKFRFASPGYKQVPVGGVPWGASLRVTADGEHALSFVNPTLILETP